MPDEQFPAGRQYVGMYRGVVVDNKDPKRVGRVRIRVPGVTGDEGGAWALMINTSGGGAAQRGQYQVPDIGADVVVWFEQGDMDHPYYAGGNFGQEEVPAEVSDPDNDEEQATKVAVWETERWRIKLDGRFGKGEFHIIDKVTNDVLEIDGVAAGIRIKATGRLQLEGQGEVVIASNGPVTIGGRPLIKNGKPIQ